MEDPVRRAQLLQPQDDVPNGAAWQDHSDNGKDLLGADLLAHQGAL